MEGAEFNADSAYKFIVNQVNYGPRVPNTSNHEKCGDWLVSKLENMGCQVSEQKGEVIAFNGAKLPVRNIIGNLNPNSKTKVLFMIIAMRLAKMISYYQAAILD